MAKHTELVGVPLPGGRCRFCLDQVIRDDEDGRVEYAFVWRGNRRSPNWFIARPAYFDFTLLATTMQKALAEGKIPSKAAKQLLRVLSGAK